MNTRHDIAGSQVMAILALAALATACPASQSPVGPDATDSDTAVDSQPLDSEVRDATPGDAADGELAAEVIPSVSNNFGVVESSGPSGCDNLDPSHCSFPFPSDHFRDRSGAAPQLRLGVSLPQPNGTGPLTDEHYRDFDGFSIAGPLRFHIGVADLDAADVARWDSIDRSLSPTSPTIVWDTELNQQVAHWVEVDHFSAPATPVTTLRFPTPLEPGRRYIAAVRNFVGPQGATLAPTAAFGALRDQTASQWRGVHERRQHFEDQIFGPLASAGVERATLQLAWDFTTATRANSISTATAMRDTLLEVVGEQGPVYTIDEVEVLVDDADIARIIRGTVQVPSFVLPLQDNVRRIRRDAAGAPTAQGLESVEFEIQVSHGALASPGSGAVIQYGHGLLGAKSEANSRWLRQLAQRHGALIVAADMQGMREQNIVQWAEVLGSPDRFPHLSEEPLQGVINHLAIVRMLKGGFTSETDPLASDGGAPLYDPAQIYYYGNSQGGTLGTVIMALSTDLERGVLGVPGCAFEFLLHRSTGFEGFAQILSLTYSKTEFVALMGHVQVGFSQLEGLAFAALLRDSNKRVLLHVAKEDSVVDNKVSNLLGRALEAKLLEPSVRPVWGMASVGAPASSGNTFVEVDFGHPDNPNPYAPAPVEFDTHEDLRRNVVAQEQLWTFLATGQVPHLCEGVCDPN